MAKPNFQAKTKLVSELQDKEPRNCFQCMKCTSGCTSLKLLELKPHELVKLANLGFIDELADSEIIWTCARCMKCVERCPQKASPYHLIIALRNLAAEKEAKIPEGYLKAISQILETALAEPLQKVVTRKLEVVDRETLKLPKIIPPEQCFHLVFMKTLEET